MQRSETAEISVRRLLRSVLLALAFLAQTPAGFAFQDTTGSRQPRQIPITDVVPQNIRAARDALFEPLLKRSRPITAEPPGAPPRISIYEIAAGMPELPVALANTIVVGEITELTPHFLTDLKGIYTEYHVKVGMTMAMPSAAGPSSFIDVVELGGAAIAQDGRIIRHNVKGGGTQLEVGRRYLFFLKYESAAQCFRMFKVWELRNGRAVATSDDDLARANKGTSVFNGVEEGVLIDAVNKLLGR